MRKRLKVREMIKVGGRAKQNLADNISLSNIRKRENVHHTTLSKCITAHDMFINNELLESELDKTFKIITFRLQKETLAGSPAEQPAPEHPEPEQPIPEHPAPEHPEPEQPAPKQLEPEEPTPSEVDEFAAEMSAPAPVHPVNLMSQPLGSVDFTILCARVKAMDAKIDKLCEAWSVQ